MMKLVLGIVLALIVGIYVGHYLTDSYSEWLAEDPNSESVAVPKVFMVTLEERYKQMSLMIRQMSDENKMLKDRIKEIQQSLI